MRLPHMPRRHNIFSRLVVTGVVLFILAYGTTLAILAANQRNLLTILMLALPAAILLCIFSARKFQLLVLLLPLAALVSPVDISTGTESKVPVSMLLCLFLTALWCASMSFRTWK